MIKRESGFTLIELMISVVIFLIVIVTASQMFTGLLTQFKQRSKVAETNTEGIVGLEIFRQDLEYAGYGLPWNLNGATYREIEAESLTDWIDRDFNDGPPDNPTRGTDLAGASNPPAGIRSRADYGLNSSDVIVIKAVNVANITNAGRNTACSKWSELSSASPYVTTWTPASENLAPTDRVMIISPGATDANSRTLVLSGTSFWTAYSGVTALPWRPLNISDTRLVYGIDSNTDPRMPFNRADYYIKIPSSSSDLPTRCASATRTGVLYKSVLRQDNGTHFELPLLDCVADMQVVYALDTNKDGTVDTYGDGDSIAFLSTRDVRDEVKEIRVYILAHEGQKDSNYRFTNFTTGACATCIRVGETLIGNYRDFDLRTITPGKTDYLNYRWKIYTIVVASNNLKGM
jgi:prepilin-type N-terminal cleavage/methylation domain-containing protein